MLKDEENILKAARKKQITYNGTLIRIADFSSETIKAEYSGKTYSKCWEKKLSTKNSKPSKTTFRKDKIKTFPDIQKLREFVGGQPILQKILKEVLQAESK